MARSNMKTWMEPKTFKPVKILDVEISKPLEEISAAGPDGIAVYQRAWVLIRLHGLPLGLTILDFNAGLISKETLAGHLWDQLGIHINHHLQQDGLPLVNSLPESGLPTTALPACQQDRLEMLKDAPLVSIIVSTRDRAQSLTITLDSLFSLEYPSYEVILVDNAPKTNDTRSVYEHNVERFFSKNVSLRYVREDIPGLAVAHNRGLEDVRGSIVAFTDDDVVVDKKWLGELLFGFRAADAVGCVTGLVIPSELRSPSQVLFEEFGGFTKGFQQRIFDLNKHHPRNSLFPYTAGRFGTGANMAFKTDLLQKTGGFDPALGIGTPAMGGDDIAAFFKVIVQGYQLVYQPSAIVLHQHRDTYDGLCRQMYGYGVGLTAFLTKCIIDHPGLIFDLASKVPAGLVYAFNPDSEKNHHKTKKYPRELDLIERRGMLYGPLAYLHSRWRYRKARRSHITGRIPEGSSQSQNYSVGG